MEIKDKLKLKRLAGLITSSEVSPKMPITRLTLLSDMIFALSMTSMIFFLDFPDKGTIHSGKDLMDYYISRNSDSGVYNFLISFILVAIYWFKHTERFRYYKSTNQNHMYLEVFFLACLVLVPVANTLLANYPEIINVQAFYGLVIFFLGIFAHFSWQYATYHHRLIDGDLDRKVILFIRHETLVEPAVALLAIIMAFIYPPLWDITLLLIPVAFILQKKYSTKILKNEQD